MASSPAAQLSQALSGTGKASSYGGYNPFSAQSATATDPGSQLTQQVQQNQTDYQSQQDSSKAQLFASIAPSSVGGQVQSNGQDLARNANAAGSSNFTNALATINQTGVDATQAAQQAAAANFAKKMSAMSSQYGANSLSLGGGFSSADVANMLPGNSLGQYATGADPNSNYGARAVALAQQVVQRGVPYVWGGNSLTQGVDCSGLVQQVYSELGIHLPRTSTEQAKFGKIVPSIQQALPGDLILMYSPYEPAGLQQFGHVGIYIGNGMMIDAAHTGTKVRIEPIVNMTRIVRPW